MSSSRLLWRPMSIGRDLSEMMLVQERAKAASLRDAEWQSQLAARRVAPTPAAATRTAAGGFPQESDFSDAIRQADADVLGSVAQLRADDPSDAGQNCLDVGDVPQQQHQGAVVAPVEQDEKVSGGGSLLRFGQETVDGRSGRQDSGDGHDARSLTDDQLEPLFETELSCDSGASAARSRTERRPASWRDRGVSGVRKIRRRRLTKEEEAKFAPEQLKDLRGTTAAKSRKMSTSEHDVMLHKRRLRNRESAARSRDKQRKTINELSDEMSELLTLAHDLKRRAISAETEAKLSRDRLVAISAKYEFALAENERLRSEVQQVGARPPTLTVQGPPKLRRNMSSALQLSFSSENLDKTVAGNQMALGPMGGGVTNEILASQPNLSNPSAQSPRPTSGLLRIPSTMHMSFSSDKLDSLVFQSLPRNFSFVDRLLGESGMGQFMNPACSLQGYAQLGSSSARPPLSSYAGISGNLWQS